MSQRLKLYPTVMVDVAVFSINEDHELDVLLVRRANTPQKGWWALPGGILEPDVDASLEAAARRVLRKKVSVEIPHLEEVCTFSGKDRDPRGWSISVLFYALLPRDQVNAVVKDKVETVEWVSTINPERRMAFDHEAQLVAALQALREKVAKPVLPLHLMPRHFTLTALQRTCEAILGRSMDKSGFRRNLKDSPDLVKVDDFELGRQRPAQFYRAVDGFRFIV
jgi:8-oxo-dGTP diphosphatase